MLFCVLRRRALRFFALCPFDAFFVSTGATDAGARPESIDLRIEGTAEPNVPPRKTAALLLFVRAARQNFDQNGFCQAQEDAMHQLRSVLLHGIHGGKRN